ncbi:STAS/SEC14 domain-containing protein [Rhodoferax saidenbachensis]|uniref:STAS/SEC14 domain-containing protein n=1 Tax=Rhodoferax saidenbachensis TaxID=1484693 RepID=A0A1P8KDW6_9BURK|nr:STAS/SEC14 domain-containing protein [Rhodoferax saidenbachensis]APW44220.1 hypothetical protein RS694_17915 [Rhodoferax saidenbachensis]
MNPKIKSAELAAGSFPPHGHTEFETLGEIVIAHTTGPFNLEGILAHNRARLALLAANPITTPQCLMTVLRTSVMMAPDCLDAFRAGLHEAYDGRPRLTAVAWVPDGPVEGFEWMEKTYAAAYAEVGIPMRNFSNQEEAMAWLRQCLAGTP